MKRVKQWFQWFGLIVLGITWFILAGALSGLVACAQEEWRWLNLFFFVFDGVMAGVWISALKKQIDFRREFPNCSPDSAYKFQNYPDLFFPCPKCGEAAAKGRSGTLSCLTCGAQSGV